ncbi:thioredoxin domain-containing protein [Microbacterium sp. C5A9]|uniref:DsbA family protein n=1 Tax=Microbacterium sp. C5A9 TaxID=2736663 RepID=UPI001F51D19A|nr:thioredoxin domain-containing protein [Microbacterium sp. C5A9]MCI1019226.1 thioredoxin domain-containing protein [Microbacterium sp. C5A9]
MAAAKSNTNWFVIGVSAAVVVVLAVLATVVVLLNNQANDPGATPTANDSFNSETGAISFGEGEDEVSIFVDFQCPVCKSFEEQYGEALETAAADGRITLNYHPIAILDRYSQGTEYSSRSAGAAVCVAESTPELYLDYAKTLFDNQPAENGSGLTTEQLADFATQVGADDAVSCITDETYRKFGKAQADKHEISGTPTVEVNGTRLDLQNQADFKTFTDLIS